MSHTALNYEGSKDYKALRKQMLDNLKGRGMTEKIYTDKVEEYMNLWLTLQKLNEDIKQRGVQVPDYNGILKENKSIAMSVQVSKQLLSLWNALGFKDYVLAINTDNEDTDEL